MAQGNDHRVSYNDAIDFISKQDVPPNRAVTYATFILDYRPLKSDPYRVCITVDRDQLIYPDNAGSPTSNIIETKILVNSVISDAHCGAKFMSMDIKDYFLNTPMDTPEYMKVHYKHIPTDIRLRYNLNSKVTTDNYQYIKIKKGMYGLRQAAILAYKYLQTTLQPFGYFPIPGTVGMWKHHTRPIHFCLCVDDFGIKYFNKNDVQHLQQAISTVFQYSTDWSGKKFVECNLIGIIKMVMSMYLCLTMLKRR